MSDRDVGITRAVLNMHGASNPNHELHIDAALSQLIGEARAMQLQLTKPIMPSPRRLRKMSRDLARAALKVVEWANERECKRG